MPVFFSTLAIYTAILVLYRPEPASLREQKPGYWKNFCRIKASWAIGVFIILCYLGITKGTFKEPDDMLIRFFSLNNIKEAMLLWPVQFFTNVFVHNHLIHLATNLIGLIILSAYERRVGAKRYLAILLIGAWFSSASVWFYSQPILNMGISGGLFALAAAYFTDHQNLTGKEWLQAIALFIFMAILISLDDNKKTAEYLAAQDMQIDYLGHMLGAVAGIIYCRLRPSKKTGSSPAISA